jgi:hypothetical protein
VEAKCLSLHCNRPQYCLSTSTHSFLENLLLYSSPLRHLGHIEFPPRRLCHSDEIHARVITEARRMEKRDISLGSGRLSARGLSLSGDIKRRIYADRFMPESGFTRAGQFAMYVCALRCWCRVDCAHSMNKPESTLPNNQQLTRTPPASACGAKYLRRPDILITCEYAHK